MITLLASIAGFIGSIFPELIKIMRDKSDMQHELAILDRQMELQKSGFNQRTQEIINFSELAENRALYRTYKSGIHWVDALNASVRPVVAYAFFLLYAVIKIIQFCQLSALSISYNFYEIIWNQDDQAIFAGIISFYFGQRAMNKISPIAKMR